MFRLPADLCSYQGGLATQQPAWPELAGGQR